MVLAKWEPSGISDYTFTLFEHANRSVFQFFLSMIFISVVFEVRVEKKNTSYKEVAASAYLMAPTDTHVV